MALGQGGEESGPDGLQAKLKLGHELTRIDNFH